MTAKPFKFSAALAAVVLATGCATEPVAPPSPPAESSVASPPPPPPPPAAPISVIEGNAWSARMEQLSQAAQQAQGVVVSKTMQNEVRIRVSGEDAFEKGSRATLSPGLGAFLEKFGLALSSQPELRVRVVGHTDNIGAVAVNDRIAMERAQVVVDRLVSHGVEVGRVRAESRGEHEPLVANDSPANRTLNRRVELFVSEPVAP
jgi:outer membrane protein OmpA-like peptidoglycan-associated protein